MSSSTVVASIKAVYDVWRAMVYRCRDHEVDHVG